MTDHIIHVAVGVIVNSQQKILIALRPKQIHQGGLWEFPGGKVERNETVQQALIRELEEELGIKAIGMRPLLDILHDYGDKAVKLDVWWVDQFDGVPSGREGQPVQWVDAEGLNHYHFPEANKAIINAVQESLLNIT